MLPQTVQDCLRERKYFIAVGAYSTHFFMEIREKYDPHNGMKFICDINYTQLTDSLVLGDLDALDPRLAKYIKDTIRCMGRSDEPAMAFYETFKDLGRIIHF